MSRRPAPVRLAWPEEPAGDLGFGTKAQTLARLAPLIKHARILPFTFFTVRAWRERRAALLERLVERGWAGESLIVRSSARHEDEARTLQPGRYVTVAGVRGLAAVADAVEQVIASYARDRGDREDADDEVLIQPMLHDATLSGVAFTCDPNTGAPYLVVNYDQTGDTAAVTGGRAGELRTFYCWKDAAHGLDDPRLERVLELARELELLLGRDHLDVEFGFDRAGTLYLFQVRPLPVVPITLAEVSAQRATLARIAEKITAVSRPHPRLKGSRTILGVMPDWNPAEILGTRPRALAASLYRALITDATWAEARYRLGYRDVRGVPLMHDLAGLPHIDVRAAFNSLVPAGLDDDLAERLVEHYLARLVANPALHDKIEFDIVCSCYTPQLTRRLDGLADHGFSVADRDQLAGHLRALTNALIDDHHPVRVESTLALVELRRRFDALQATERDPVALIYWQLEDCRRYGTPAFAAFARLGFIAMELLASLVAAGVLDDRDHARFMSGLDTVTNRMQHARGTATRAEFLGTYGHLRPSTYDIRRPRYDEAPDLYFDWSRAPEPAAPPEPFALDAAALRRLDALLAEHGFAHDGAAVLRFIKAGIELREDSKFEFSRQLSAALSTIARLGAQHGLDPDACSHVPIDCFRDLYLGTDDVAQVLDRRAAEGRRRWTWASRIVLPPLITDARQVLAFDLSPTEPNFITHQAVMAPVACSIERPGDLDGAIALIASADPGYDWIFSRGIVGLITKYGGANSHMAIRAHQFGIPAAVGVGEALYARCAAARMLMLDGANRRIEVLR